MLRDTLICGFDSAWTDSKRGALAMIGFDDRGAQYFFPPRLVTFAEALMEIQSGALRYARCIVALDQPTIVPNATGCRPVERIAKSVVEHCGGGVQPSSRARLRMFCDNAAIWPFKQSLAANDDPHAARLATTGAFLIEVFPALALSGLSDQFFGPKRAPKYNPGNRRKYQQSHWTAVCSCIAGHALQRGLADMAHWADAISLMECPRKGDQDCVDAVICTLIGVMWLADPPEVTMMIGNLETGYIVTPVSPGSRKRLDDKAQQLLNLSLAS